MVNYVIHCTVKSLSTGPEGISRFGTSGHVWFRADSSKEVVLFRELHCTL